MSENQESYNEYGQEDASKKMDIEGMIEEKKLNVFVEKIEQQVIQNRDEAQK